MNTLALPRQAINGEDGEPVDALDILLRQSSRTWTPVDEEAAAEGDALRRLRSLTIIGGGR